MKRWILLISVLLVFLGLTLVGFGSWLLQSTAGTAWLLDVVADVADVQITTGSLEGRLADELILEELSVAWPEGQMTVQRIHLNWEPFSVLQRKLNVRSLVIDQLVIVDADTSFSPDTRPNKDIQAIKDEQAVREDETDFSVSDLAFLPDWLENITVNFTALFVGEGWHLTLGLLFMVIVIFRNYAVGGLTIAAVVAASLLELLVAFLQAYIFTFLSAIFIGFAVNPEH